jgi:hypothetical protein
VPVLRFASSDCGPVAQRADRICAVTHEFVPPGFPLVRHGRSASTDIRLWFQVLLLLFLVAAASHPQGQGFGTVYIDRQTSMDPVSIEKITIGDELIHPGVMDPRGRVYEPATQFQANKDWLKEMSIVLKNRTDKVIVAANIELWFPDTGDGSNAHPVNLYRISIGQRPDVDLYRHDGTKGPSDSDKPPLWFEPNKTLVIQIADYFNGIQGTIEERPGDLGSDQPLSRLTRVVVRQMVFCFEDGMRWTDLEGFSIPDFDHPGQFTKQDRGRYFPGNPSQNWPPSDAPGEARVTF